MNNQNGQNNGFSSGFLLGILVGAALVFLLGTEKGKKIVKAITEGGLDRMDEIKEMLEKNIEEVEDEYEEPIEKKIIAKKPKPSNGHAVTVPSNSSPSIVHRTKRLFRGIPKRK